LEKGSRPELHGYGLEERKTANDAKLQEEKGLTPQWMAGE
jgi:hypothetical protein